MENVVLSRWIEDLPLCEDLPSKVTDRSEERKAQLQKLRSDLHTLQRNHQLRTRNLPTLPRKARRSLPEISQPLLSGQPERIQKCDVTEDSEAEYEYINPEGMIPGSRQVHPKDDDRPPVPPPRNSSLRTLKVQNHVTSRAGFDPENDIASPRKLLRVFAERFNRRKSLGVSTPPPPAFRIAQGTRAAGLLRRLAHVSHLSSTGCASMTSGSGYVCTSRSCQLSSADCTQTLSVVGELSDLTENRNRQNTSGEKKTSGSEGGANNACEFFGELSSIHHLTSITSDYCSCCPLVVKDSPESSSPTVQSPCTLEYPKSSTPNVEYPKSSTPNVQYPKSSTPNVQYPKSSTHNVQSQCTLDTPATRTAPSGECNVAPSGERSEKQTVKRVLSETFVVSPASTTEDPPRDSKPRVHPAMGVSARRTRVPVTTRPQCLGSERTITETPGNGHPDVVTTGAASPSNGPCNQTVDSDATMFMQGPMCQKAVTYKLKVSRRSKVKGQLRGLGRQIRDLGAEKLNLNTLAVL